MRYIPRKIKNTYQRSGILGLLDRFSDIMLGNIYTLDWYVRKHSKENHDIIDRLVESNIGNVLTYDNLTEKKTSDTLFVLGSGKSINDISEAEWNLIEQKDSIGLNRWPIHNHVPTYYVFEIPSNPDIRNKLWKILEYRHEEYSNSMMIMKDVGRTYRSGSIQTIPSSIQNEIFLSPDIQLPPILRSSKSTFDKVVKQVLQRGYLNQEGRIENIFRKTGSISYILFLSYILNYDQVVLCGVDLVDSDYFWHEQENALVGDDLPMPQLNHTRSRDGIHATNDPSRQPIPIEEVIYSIRDYLLVGRDINLYIQSKKSALHPRVPAYNLKV